VLTSDVFHAEASPRRMRRVHHGGDDASGGDVLRPTSFKLAYRSGCNIMWSNMFGGLSKGPHPKRLSSKNAVLQRVKQLVTSAKETMTGRDIKDLRNALGLSQRKLAEILNVSPMTIVRAERTGPSRALVLYIERALSEGSLKLSDRKVDPRKRP
jgi:DNA-binding transcriptional regulator YiaG